MAATDPSQVAVWEAMAEHFLDTETRHEVPLTALRCLEADLSPAAAEHIWRNEVVPTVGSNLLSIAGEWAGWDRNWLVTQLEARRQRSANGSWFSLARVAAKPYWRAINACITDLLEHEPAQRAHRAQDLAGLGRIYFDMALGAATHSEQTRQRLTALYPEPFERLLGALIQKQDRRAAEQRIRAALL